MMTSKVVRVSSGGTILFRRISHFTSADQNGKSTAYSE